MPMIPPPPKRPPKLKPAPITGSYLRLLRIIEPHLRNYKGMMEDWADNMEAGKLTHLPGYAQAKAASLSGAKAGNHVIHAIAQLADMERFTIEDRELSNYQISCLPPRSGSRQHTYRFALGVLYQCAEALQKHTKWCREEGDVDALERISSILAEIEGGINALERDPCPLAWAIRRLQ